ncbi:hypothetical protein [Burkholderia mallei]|uniref:hypothetical protein n=1 Tax=Burkholderia mallei TaxID=13373 RepID=UPI00387360A0
MPIGNAHSQLPTSSLTRRDSNRRKCVASCITMPSACCLQARYTYAAPSAAATPSRCGAPSAANACARLVPPVRRATSAIGSANAIAMPIHCRAITHAHRQGRIALSACASVAYFLR